MRERKDLWQGMRSVDFNTPCVFIGDFNAVHRDDHRKNGSQVSTYRMYDIQRWMDDMELRPLREQGHA